MPSTAIDAFSYDEALSALTVRFVGGATYVYSLVPAAVVRELEAARSRGAFVNARIKDRYPFRRIAEAKKAPARARPAKPAAPSLRERLGASLFDDE
jgi:lysyl-tRNA synthetase class 2